MSKTILVSANQAWNLVNFRKNLLLALMDRGFGIAAAAPYDLVQAKRLEAIGCSFHPIEIDAKGLSPLRDAKLFVAYLNLMRRIRPVAYLGWTIKPNIYGAMAARTLGIPALPNVSGLGTAFVRHNLLTEVVSLLYRAGFARAATVFVQNDADQTVFLERGLAKPTQLRRLAGSGVDKERFSPASDSRKHRGTFLLIARLLADKGVREYVEAARILRAEDSRRRFVILGFADVENRTAISRGEIDSWIADGVIEIQAPVEDVRFAIEAADCIVLPSYREGTSRVLLEGAAMARPLVATDVPGCREVVDDGVNGLLCKVADVPTLVSAMRRIDMLDDVAWRAMGKAGRIKVLVEFSEAAVIDAYLSALRDAGVF